MRVGQCKLFLLNYYYGAKVKSQIFHYAIDYYHIFTIPPRAAIAFIEKKKTQVIAVCAEFSNRQFRMNI